MVLRLQAISSHITAKLMTMPHRIRYAYLIVRLTLLSYRRRSVNPLGKIISRLN